MRYTITPSGGSRLASMVIDFLSFMIFFWILSMIVVFPFMTKALDVMKPSHDSIPFNFFPDRVMYFMGFMYALYFCKDAINGKSLGKRAMKLQVVNNKNEMPANPMRCIVRNIFAILWPLEGLIAVLNPSRRIGDFVAGTKVVKNQEVIDLNEDVEEGVLPSPKYLQAVITYVITALVVTLISVQWTSWVNSKMYPQSPYVRSSFNESLSNKLQKQYNTDFGEMLTSDVKVFDEMIESSDIKYVSVILNVDKPVFMTEKELYDSVVVMAKQLYPMDSVKGKVQYVVPTSGNMPMSHIVTKVWTF